MPRPTRLLTRSDTANVASLPRVIDAVRVAFEGAADDRLERIRVPFEVPDGSFHLVAGPVVTPQGPRFVIKANGWFPGGITGSVVLADAADGAILAVMDAAVLTRVRTAAMSGVVAGALVAPAATTIGLLGAGRQAALQAPAVRTTTGLERVRVFDPDTAAMQRLVDDLADQGFDAHPAASAEDCAQAADVLVSVVPSTSPIVDPGAIGPGTLVVALGADAPGKREHATALLERASVFTDVTDLCARYGELQHAIADGVLGAESVVAELGEVLAGHHPGRMHADEVILFDSTGSAIQDAAAASVMVEDAERGDVGQLIDLVG